VRALGLLGGLPRQRVLGDVEGGAGRAQGVADLGRLADGEAAVVGDDQRLGLPDLGHQALDNRCLVISVHSLTSFVAVCVRF
jgi:hypothetical protein